MKQVFLSYAREDLEFTRLLEEELRENGHAVWLDSSSILGGTDWEREIKRALDNSYAVIVILSESSINSEWVSFEVEYVRNHREKIKMIPLKIDDSEIPDSLRKTQAIDFSLLFKQCDVHQIRVLQQNPVGC